MEKNPRAEMLDFEKIGDRLRDLRKQKGITQQQIADVLDIGRNQYQKYEKGITLVPSYTLSEKQVNRAYAKAAAANMSNDDVLLWIGKKFWYVGNVTPINTCQISRIIYEI